MKKRNKKYPKRLPFNELFVTDYSIASTVIDPTIAKPCSNHYFLRVLCALFEHLLHEL